ncbi:type III pantothenate kinase, partial [Burkholderia mallei]|nr:type III pantothenate kinase [Burkholderia mallei]
MCLLIDAGNSRIKWALADTARHFVTSGAFEHASDAPDWSTLPAPRGAWISNVAGDAAAARIDALIEARWPALPRTV